MTTRTTSSTVIARIFAVAGAILAAAAIAAGQSPAADAADGVTATKLAAAGWTCFVPPSGGNRIVCFDPGVGRPFPGNPDPAPSYDFLGFDLTTGEFLYRGHLIRADLYQGQRCAPGDGRYSYLALIGYYECLRAKES